MAAQTPGKERQWADTVERVLAGIEHGLRSHIELAESPDGLFAEVDCARASLDRQADELRRNHDDLLGQTIALRRGLQRAARGKVVGASSFGALCQRAEELSAGLLQSDEAETRLILESINTDIGTGD